MSNKQVRKKRSASSSKRKRVTLPHQPSTEEEQPTIEEDIELDHTPKKVKSDVALEPEIETPTETEEPIVAKVTSDDSDDDLLNDTSFAQFCDPSIVKKVGFNENCLIDYEYERKLIEQQKKDMDETLRVKRINDELNRLIQEEINNSNTRIDLNSLTNDQKKDHLKKLMEGTGNEIEISILEHVNNEGSYDQYYKDLRIQLFCEEMSRFNVFKIAGYVSVKSINADNFISEFVQFLQPKYEYCAERYDLFCNTIEYSVQEIGSNDILDDLGLACLQPTKEMNQPFVSVEEAVIVLGLLDKKKCIRLQRLIRKTVDSYVNGREIDISEHDLACLAIHFLISQYFNFGNYISKPDTTLNPYSIYSTLSKTKLINTTELTFILKSLEGDYATLITNLFNLFGFSQGEEDSTLQGETTIDSLNSVIQKYFPPTFSKFLISRPFYNTSKTIITFYKKFFACMLINVTGITEISHEEIFSTDYEFNNTTNRKLVTSVIPTLERLLEQCKERKEFEFPLLHLIKNVLSIFDICADLGRDSSFVRDELLKLSTSLRPHFQYSDFTFLKLQFPYLDASFMQNLTDEDS